MRWSADSDDELSHKSGWEDFFFFLDMLNGSRLQTRSTKRVIWLIEMLHGNSNEENTAEAKKRVDSVYFS